MVAKFKFWLLQRSMSITKASLPVTIIYVTVFFINNWAMLYEELHILSQLDGHFLLYLIALLFVCTGGLVLIIV